MGRMFDDDGRANPADLREWARTGNALRRGSALQGGSFRLDDGRQAVELVHQDTGGTAGYDIHHPSGSDRDGIVDRVLTPPPLTMAGGLHSPGGES